MSVPTYNTFEYVALDIPGNPGGSGANLLVDALHIAPNGKVGIGTATPANSLDVGIGGGIHVASGIPSSTSMALYNNSGTLTWNGAALSTGIAVSGTTNYLPMFTGTNSLGNSAVYQTAGSVGVGTTTPAAVLDVYGTGQQSAMLVPRDVTTNRPTAAVNGMLRYNTTTAALETYANNAWTGSCDHYFDRRVSTACGRNDVGSDCRI